MATVASTAVEAPAKRRTKYGSMSRDREWALRWSYFFLVIFAVFFLLPPIYMLITSLKTSAEISAATNPWWVFHPTLDNYRELLTSNSYLTYFRNSAIVSVFVVTLTMLISVPAAFAFPPYRDQQFLYVVDSGAMRVVIFDRRAMAQIGAVGMRGAAAGEFDIVHHMAADSKGNLYTAEIVNNRRAQKFVPAGTR